MEAQEFVDKIAEQLMPWGMPQASARLYGYLLLNTEPVSLDEFAEALEMSKSTASVAARLLVQHKLARRHAVRGSKRILFSATENYAGLFEEQASLLGQMGSLLNTAATDIASKDAAKRMREMAHFFLVTREALQATIAALKAEGIPKK